MRRIENTAINVGGHFLQFLVIKMSTLQCSRLGRRLVKAMRMIGYKMHPVRKILVYNV